MKLGIIGSGISYTLSPFIHGTIGRLKGLELSYSVYDRDDIEKFAPVFEAIDGFNVTIPFKRDILKYVDEMDSLTEKIGAANTVVRSGGRLTAYNTDAAGFMQALERDVPDYKNYRIVILGCGGSARAVFAAFSSAGIKGLEIHCRDGEKSGRLAGEWEARLYTERGTDPVLWVNCTPVRPEIIGDAGQHRPGDAVYHLSYGFPAGDAGGIMEFNGSEMLLQQALAAAQIWFGGLTFSEDETEYLRRALAAERQKALM